MCSSSDSIRPVENLTYHDTRDLDADRPLFLEVVLKGIAKGGGLYVPVRLPMLDLQEIKGLAALPYSKRAAAIFALFGVDVSAKRLEELMGYAYGSNFDTPEVAPVVEVEPGMYALELWHGPTSAFKDMALQCMPLFFSEAVSVRRNAGGSREKFLILVATSGDTGKAALEGFADRRHTRIIVFYPADGVSDTQRLQMITQRGGNVAVYGVDGNFDDCQNAVKAAFNDEAFNAELYRRWRIKLSSANSINWGRLLPQVVYYASAYADMIRRGGITLGELVDVCVPTGNFGNILGAWYAKKIGVPLGRLICASNENNVLTDFINSGVYDISQRPFIKTPSPSMDILVSSNLERLLFEICGDGAMVRGWAADLAEKKRFEVDAATMSAIHREFLGDFVTNECCLETIRQMYRTTNYLLDPHTAVAWEAGRRHKSKAPLLVVATAHWAKFGEDVFRALAGLPGDAPIGEDPNAKGGHGLLRRIAEMAPGQAIPRPLEELVSLEKRFTEKVQGSKQGVEQAVLAWLSG